MKTAFFGLGLAVLVPSANAIDYEVASCAELADIDDTTVTSLTITSSPFVCDSYTRFPVRNDMFLKSDSAVVFSNFALKVLGTLVVEHEVTFRDVTEQETNGGALYLEKGSSAAFRGAASFIENSVIPGGGGFRPGFNPRNGGAVYNKGDLAFGGPTLFEKNKAVTRSSTDEGKGGAIYNARTGSITFYGPLTVNENDADGFFEGEGGGIFNAGEIVLNAPSSFTENTAADGGAIFVHPTGTITFYEFATFTENRCFDSRGGAIASLGSLNILGGSLFLSNFADSSGDGGSGGAIYNSLEGSLTFGGVNTFDDNSGYIGGAIYNGENASFSPPQDGGELIFQNVRGEVCPAIYTKGADPECSP